MGTISIILYWSIWSNLMISETTVQTTCFEQAWSSEKTPCTYAGTAYNKKGFDVNVNLILTLPIYVCVCMRMLARIEMYGLTSWKMYVQLLLPSELENIRTYCIYQEKYRPNSCIYSTYKTLWPYICNLQGCVTRQLCHLTNHPKNARTKSNWLA